MLPRYAYQIRAQLASDLRDSGFSFDDIMAILRLPSKEGARQHTARGARLKREKTAAENRRRNH